VADRITVVVPDLGDFHDVEVIEVLAKAGDEIAVEAPLITLETDKATMDVPSTAAGRVAEMSVKKGDRVSKGSAIAVLEASGSGSAPPAAAPAAGADKAGKPAAAKETPAAREASAPASDLEVRVPDLGDFKDV
jgi:pyruvate/2-oxoglutarate dehydrogenase complex dihydrolipoamide acyltransferase (E2) component